MELNEQLFEAILGHTSDMLLICDRNRHIKYVTPNIFENIGYRPEEFINRDTFDIVHPEDKDYLIQRHKSLLDSKQSNSSEYRIVRKNGEVRYYECKTTPLPETEEYLQVVTTRDITDRKLLELELKRHKNRHEVLQNSLKNFSADLSSVMKFDDLEDRLLKELNTILPGSNPSIFKDYFANNILKNSPVGKMEKDLEKIYIKIGERLQKPIFLSIDANSIHEKMESIWLETLGFYSVMVFENLNMIEGLMNQLDTALKSQETPKWVLRMMFNLQEQQRMTLSSDLHDTVLQDQIDLYRRMESILQRYEFDYEVKQQLKSMEQGLLDMIHDIRVTCNNLRPPLLRELGIKTALENLFEHIQVMSTYKIIFNTYGLDELDLSEEVTITIYRIIQELLYYAEVYSKATEVRFSLSYENALLKLLYRDDGHVMEVPIEETYLNHLGLTSIIQRTQSLGGQIEFHPEKSGGFVAALEILINEKRSLL